MLPFPIKFEMVVTLTLQILLYLAKLYWHCGSRYIGTLKISSTSLLILGWNLETQNLIRGQRQHSLEEDERKKRQHPVEENKIKDIRLIRWS